MAKDLDTAVAAGETRRLQRALRRAPHFWAQWGAAWKTHGCAQGILRPSCGGRRFWGPRGWEGHASPGAPRRVGARWRRPVRPGRRQGPSVTPRTPRGGGTAARPGERGVGPRPEGATPRLAPLGQVPAASPPPRVKVKVSPVRSAGGGAGADLRAGAGRRRGHGWAQPPPPSQPATEARPRGSVPCRAGRGRGAGAGPEPGPRLTAAGAGRRGGSGRAGGAVRALSGGPGSSGAQGQVRARARCGQGRRSGSCQAPGAEGGGDRAEETVTGPQGHVSFHPGSLW